MDVSVIGAVGVDTSFQAESEVEDQGQKPTLKLSFK